MLSSYLFTVRRGAVGLCLVCLQTAKKSKNRYILWSFFEDFELAIRSCVQQNKPSLEDIQSFVLLRLKLFFSALLAKVTYQIFSLLITLTSKLCVLHEAFYYFYVKRRIRNLLITYQYCNDQIKFQNVDSVNYLLNKWVYLHSISPLRCSTSSFYQQESIHTCN